MRFISSAWLHRLIIPAAAAVGIAIGQLGAGAYNNSVNTNCKWSYSGGSSLTRPKYAYDTGTYAPTGIYAVAMHNARVNWDATASSVLFLNVVGQSSFLWQVRPSSPNGFLGETFRTFGGNNLFNLTTVILYSQSIGSDDWLKQWTASHEMGHQIKLGHTNGLAPYLGGTIYVGGTMTPSPDTSGPSGPNGARPDDVCAANQVYVGTIWPPTTPCGY